MDWYRLRVMNIKDSVISKLMESFDSYWDIFKLAQEQLQIYFNLDGITLREIYQSKEIDIEKELEELATLKIKVVSLKDKDYPLALKNISHPPLFLYYKGDLSLAHSDKIIAIVGTRSPSNYGKRACEKITFDLINSSITTVSGLALGIDGICHKTSLENTGKTIAVVGSGLNNPYPRHNSRYWHEIAEKGLLISEFPLDTEPLNFHFPLRNRIIVGLSKGVVVVESKARGGSLITASLALEEGRDVFAVPGEIYSETSSGTNELIKNSEAKLITSGEDVINEFNWEILSKDNTSLKLNPDELIIYNNLNNEKTLDELIIITQMKPKLLLALLMDMEINGYISSISGGKYIRKNN